MLHVAVYTAALTCLLLCGLLESGYWNIVAKTAAPESNLPWILVMKSLLLNQLCGTVPCESMSRLLPGT